MDRAQAHFGHDHGETLSVGPNSGVRNIFEYPISPSKIGAIRT